MEQRAAIALTVNGEPREFRGRADTPLLWVLRDAFGLKGTKYGCGAGDCGSCVVLVQGEPRHSCTLPILEAAGKNVLTIEALAREPQQPLIQAWIAEQVPQCGYCQPAQLLTASWLLKRHPQPSDAQIDDAMSYVLCRCGSYPRIRRAIHRAAAWALDAPRQGTQALGALPAAAGAGGGVMLNPWLRVNRDRSLTLMVDRSEMGQGVITGLAMLVAEEMEIGLDRLRIEFAPAAPEYANALIGEQATGGSTSIRAAWDSLREAAAAARERLIAAAAERWDVKRAECVAEAGEVVHHCSGRRAPYAALATAAAAGRAPRGVKPKRAREFRLIGRSVPRIEVPDLALGRAVFALDVTRPSPLDAVLARSPSFGGRVASFDASRALRVPGVVKVLEVGGAVAVVAEDVPAALAGRDALEVSWDLSGACALDSDAIRARLAAALERRGASARRRGSIERALRSAKHVVEARYETPYLAHATMEPMNCIAEVTDDACDIWVGMQSQQGAQACAMEITGLPRERVRVHTTYSGGGFGRRLETDYVAEAVRLAKMLHRAVRVLWTRADDLRHDFYRPASLTAFRAGLDARGGLSAWLQRIAGPELALGEVEIPYAIPNLSVVRIKEDPGVPTGYWRSVGASQNAFSIECFVDELAHAAGKDPLAFRLALLAHEPRHRAVLELAAERAGWHDKLAKGRGRGIAVYRSYGSWVAQVAEVSAGDGGAWRVERMVCAADCGTVVNPDAVCAQMEGAVVFGLSAALHGEITLREGAVVQSGFEDYPILRMRDTPEIEAHLVPSHAHPGGVGEPGVPPVAPAVANALFAATGRRVRRLPLQHQ
ncbi:MAG: 2Fe-2S iron-sulfur cluster binding domain-containing protein [Betaproteobacteria bacterium]|nr:MAG: 2Fe-2S iron-sulfur cluster binding domain-containing protein [Betaproteobacteria bacterium]